MSKKRIFSPEEEAFIRKEYLNIPIKRMAAMMGISQGPMRRKINEMGLVIPEHILEARRRATRFEKGHESHTKGRKRSEWMSPEAIERVKKTQFKTGNRPHNQAEKNGEIRVRHDHKDRSGRKYKWIRIEVGHWEMLHVHLWEKKHGPVPEGHCLWFKDQDSMNCELDNLELITRQENMNRNVHYLPPELNRAKKLITRINKKLELHGK